ncbi:MAG: class I SAM-dependent methyltransferase [Erysipelotrichaceae bacterium]
MDLFFIDYPAMGLVDWVTYLLVNGEMNKAELKKQWLKEEELGHILGWDFSHINDRYTEETDLPWDYRQTIEKYLKKDDMLLDYDTGGGEFLLSLKHQPELICATEGYDVNVELCLQRFKDSKIQFKACNDPGNIPFFDAYFDVIINRHGDFCCKELYRLLKKGGYFITEQVGGENDWDLIKRVLPDSQPDFLANNLSEVSEKFVKAGFSIIEGQQAFRPIEFYDIGAFVWFAKVLPWEFKGFSVEKCFDKLLQMQEEVEKKGKVTGTIHRYLLVCQK